MSEENSTAGNTAPVAGESLSISEAVQRFQTRTEEVQAQETADTDAPPVDDQPAEGTDSAASDEAATTTEDAALDENVQVTGGSEVETIKKEYRQKIETLSQSQQHYSQKMAEADELLETLQTALSRPKYTPEQIKQMTDEGDLEGAMKALVEMQNEPPLLTQIKEQRQHMAKELAALQKAQFESFKQEQVGILEKTMPALLTESGGRALSTYLRQSGFADAEIADAVDARYLMLAEKARLYDQIQAAGKSLKAEGKQPTKPLKSSAPRPDSDSRTALAKQLHAKFKQSGSLQDAVAAYRALHS